MTTKKSYFRALKEFKKIALNDKILRSEIELIALLGSAAGNEHIIGWSDLDILLLLKRDNAGNISFAAIKSLKRIGELLSKKYKLPISILPHTEDDFINYVCFEYLRHYSWGSVIYSKKENLQKFINGILRQREIKSHVRKRYCIYHLRHLRFNLLRKYISSNGHSSKKFGKLLIDNMIEASEWGLIFFNIWPKTKKDIIKYASVKFDGHFHIKPLKRAMILRSKWQSVTDNEFKNFSSAGLKYISDLLGYMVKKYPHSTPEEYMNR